MPQTVQVADETLILNGSGVRTATIFRVRVYVAALYLESKSADAQSIISSGDTKRLELHFVRSVSAASLRSMTLKAFCKLKDYPDLENRASEFCSHLVSVRKGDVLALTTHGDQLRLSINGDSRCMISGKDFCEAVMALYVGEQPIDEKLRKALLNARPNVASVGE